jgi:hypothetical protein
MHRHEYATCDRARRPWCIGVARIERKFEPPVGCGVGAHFFEPLPLGKSRTASTGITPKLNGAIQMGTNYYLIEDVCEPCARTTSTHIGKSSCGWCFSLHVGRQWEPTIPKSLEEWVERWSAPGAAIMDEYGYKYTPTEMMDVITNRRCDPYDLPDGYASWDEFHAINHSTPGPNGLLRHQIMDDHCVGHGPGAYDLIVGEFC